MQKSEHSAVNVWSVLLTLALVQFTHIMDFMIMMPLGPQFFRVFGITPSEFGHLVASYSIAAAVTGFIGGIFLDRFDRKKSLLVLYGGFFVSTLCCALSNSYWMLLFSRTIAGAFGGIAGSIVPAIVGDVIPPERRGSAMGIVMTSFSLASVLGVPAGLYFANLSDWHAPFFILSGASALIWMLAAWALPAVRSQHAANPRGAMRQLWEVLSHPTHLRAYALSFALIATGSMVIPFLSPSLVANAGLPESKLLYVYFCGGLATFISTPLFGKLSDRYDKLYVLAGATIGAAIVILILTNLRPAPMPVILCVTTLFMISMSARFAPAMAMITNSVAAKYRGGFMSINAAAQQLAAGVATILAGAVTSRDASGQLHGYPIDGILSVSFAAIALLLGRRLRHSLRTAKTKDPSGPLVVDAV